MLLVYNILTLFYAEWLILLLNVWLRGLNNKNISGTSISRFSINICVVYKD